MYPCTLREHVRNDYVSSLSLHFERVEDFVSITDDDKWGRGWYAALQNWLVGCFWAKRLFQTVFQSPKEREKEKRNDRREKTKCPNSAHTHLLLEQ